MANLIPKGIKLTAKGFNIQRKKLFAENSYLIFLKAVGTDREFDEIIRFDQDFTVSFDSFRNQAVFEVATKYDLKSRIFSCSYISFNGDLYAISDGDLTYPFGDRFSWMIRGTVIGGKTYVPTNAALPVPPVLGDPPQNSVFNLLEW